MFMYNIEFKTVNTRIFTLQFAKIAIYYPQLCLQMSTGAPCFINVKRMLYKIMSITT